MKNKILVLCLIGLMLAVGVVIIACDFSTKCEGSCGEIYSGPGQANCRGGTYGNETTPEKGRCNGTKSGCTC